MLVPGVLQGSKGPLLYPADEVRKSPDDWNHIPIVVYHPMKDGKPVSARSPSILSKYGVGFVFHSRTDSKGVLKGEGWLDVEATRRVDKSVLDSVQLGKPIELSTGLFVDDEPAPEGAIFNDHRGTRKYVGIARNYKPDHLAILPSGKGACSLADGCGVLINEAAMEAYQVIINELETEALSLYFPDIDSEQLLTANKFNPNQPRDKAGRFATVAEGTAAVSKAQERVAKAQAALKEAKATLKVEKDGLLVARKGLAEVKGIEKARSPAGQRAIDKAKASASEAHATGKRLKELSDRLTGGVGRQGKGTADLQAEGRAEASKALAGIRTKAHAAAVAEGFGILPGKTVAETKATISRHIETRIGSVARSRLTERPVHTTDPAVTGTPTAPRPAASPRARTGKGSKVAQSIVGAINGGASNLKEAFNAVKKDHPDVTLGQFHDHVKALHESGHIEAQSYNKHLASLPSNEHAIYHKNRVLYDVTPGTNTAPVKSTVEHKSLPKNLTDKLAAFVSDARAKNSFDTPSIARAHEHLKQFAPHITEGQLHDVVRQAQAERKVKAEAYTQAPATIGVSEKPFYMDHDIKNFLDAGPNIKTRVGASSAIPTAPKTATSPRAGKSGKSVDEHHADTEALSQRGVAGTETWTPAGATFKAAESHDAFNKAVDSHFANLNKSLNKAQVHELADRMGFSQTKSATKKSVLDKLKKAIHDRRDTKQRTYA
jgi:hypothetical protein